MKRIFFLLLLLIPHFTKAVSLDSIQKVLPNMPADTNKVYLLNKAFELSRGTDPSAAEKYIKDAIELAEKLHFDNGMMTTYRNYAVFLNILGKPDDAAAYFNKGLALAKSKNNKKRMGSYAMSIGTMYYDKGDYKTALENFIQSLKWREEANDTAGIADTYIWLGIIHDKGLKQPAKAISYYRSAMEKYRQKGDEASMSYAYTNIGNAYYGTREYDSALIYLDKALEIKKKAGDPAQMANIYNNIANVYTDLRDYDKALDFYKQSLTFRQQGGDEEGVATSYINIGAVLMHQRKYKEGNDYLLKALDVSLKRNFTEGILTIYQALGQSNAAMGDYKKAYVYDTLYAHYKDSAFTVENNRQMVDMQTKYETEKKDLEIQKKSLLLSNATLEISKKRVQVGILIGAIIVLLILGYLFYNRYKLKKQRELDAEMIKQQELRTKAIIEAEEKERIRIAKDLHDGVGQQLAAVKMNLSAFEEKVDRDMETQDRYKGLINMVDDAVKEVRSISHNMMPNALIRFGLATAVREFIDKIAATGLLKIDLQIVGLSERLENTTETVLYRVLQETVSNIIKHAQASKVSIQLIREGGELTMMIEDNGKGFDASKLNDFAGIGLKNIISRVEYLNGRVDFDSYPGKGTTVIVDLSVANKE